MEHSRRILRKIASTSQQVITAANEYVDRKGLFNVELRVHLQLEEEMQKVAVACESLATILPMSLQSHGGPAFDEGLKDWLTGDEPRMCYETLDQIDKLLREDGPSRTSARLTGRGMTATKDKIDEAIKLFDSRKRCFHFLFTTDIWWVRSVFVELVHDPHYPPGTTRVVLDRVHAIFQKTASGRTMGKFCDTINRHRVS